ncbi:MAG TPA: gamma-glutamyltransferase, partial [Pseudonocardia sp.]|nr:gamma-glutamyltransferase [Pseudonocardia sp.]
MTAAVTAQGFTPATGETTRPTLAGWFGMSASTHWLATGTAQSVLERGGNAFDAAVAAAFVLHVVEPHLNGPGGDLVAIVAPAGAEPRVLCGQGPAPEGASIEHFARLGLGEVPGAGALAAAVPGAVPAWLELLAEHGAWELADVLGYAVHYAERGHPAGPQLCRVVATTAELFRTDWPTSAARWLPDGQPPEPGAVITDPAYALTLRRLAQADGATRIDRIQAATRLWRSGFVAQAIAEFVRTPHRHATGGLHPGVLTVGDVERFRPSWEPPVLLEFRGTTVAKAGFWTQGPVLLQALAVLNRFDDARLDPSTAAGAHTVLEALKLALADRDGYYGDHTGATQALLTSAYAAERAALVGDTASHEFRPGRPADLRPHRPPLVTEPSGSSPKASAGAGVGEPTVARSGETRGDTCHLDVVDRFGNMVSATPSGGWLQSSPTVPELGFCLGTRLQMTWLDPASPAALRPGRRPRTTLSPTMLLRGGEPVVALGTPGGDQQDQWQLLYLLRTL